MATLPSSPRPPQGRNADRPRAAFDQGQFLAEVARLRDALKIGPGRSIESDRRRIAVAVEHAFLRAGGSVHTVPFLEWEVYDGVDGLVCAPLEEEIRCQEDPKLRQSGWDPLKLFPRLSLPKDQPSPLVQRVLKLLRGGGTDGDRSTTVRDRRMAHAAARNYPTAALPLAYSGAPSHQNRLKGPVPRSRRRPVAQKAGSGQAGRGRFVADHQTPPRRQRVNAELVPVDMPTGTNREIAGSERNGN